MVVVCSLKYHEKLMHLTTFRQRIDYLLPSLILTQFITQLKELVFESTQLPDLVSFYSNDEDNLFASNFHFRHVTSSYYPSTTHELSNRKSSAGF